MTNRAANTGLRPCCASRQRKEEAMTGEARPMRKKQRPTDYFACLGRYRTCGKPALPGELLCEECIVLKGLVTVEKPFRVLIRSHFSANSKYGQAIVSALEQNNGVRVIRRSRERQQELHERRRFFDGFGGGVRVFGEKDLRPLTAVEDATKEMEADSYCLRDIHVLDLDEVLEDGDKEQQQRQGGRTVVFNYEYLPDENPLAMPEYANEILSRPFLGCRVWVNLKDPLTGVGVHCVELISLQFQQTPRLRLKFAKSVWGFEDVTDYSREEEAGE